MLECPNNALFLFAWAAGKCDILFSIHVLIPFFSPLVHSSCGLNSSIMWPILQVCTMENCLCTDNATKPDPAPFLPCNCSLEVHKCCRPRKSIPKASQNPNGLFWHKSLTWPTIRNQHSILPSIRGFLLTAWFSAPFQTTKIWAHFILNRDAVRCWT